MDSKIPRPRTTDTDVALNSHHSAYPQGRYDSIDGPGNELFLPRNLGTMALKGKIFLQDPSRLPHPEPPASWVNWSVGL